MSERSVNYDQVASTYNRRFEGQKERPIASALENLIQESGANQVLEVGCGTGRWLMDLLACQAIEPGCLFGLDRSSGMLRQALDRQAGLQLVQGLAEMLPLSDGCFDLVYVVNALHHFNQPEQFIRHTYHLLRPGGQLAVIGMDPRNFLSHPDRPARARWYVYEYFHGTLETDLARFPSWGQVLDWMLMAGFDSARLRRVEQVLDSKTGSTVWSDPFLEKNSTSQLILLTDEEYQHGLDRMKASLAEAGAANQILTFPVDLLIDMLVAWKPDER